MFRLTFLTLIASLSLAYAQDEVRPAADWQPIWGLPMTQGKIYIDRKSLKTTHASRSRQYNTADLLISYNEPTKIFTDREIIVRSRVQSVIIECDSRLTAPIYDLYFAEPIPTRDSKPIGGKEYPDPRFTAFTLKEDSIMYGVLCPKYI